MKKKNQPALINTSSSVEHSAGLLLGTMSAFHQLPQSSQSVSRPTVRLLSVRTPSMTVFPHANCSRTAACRLGGRPHYKRRRRLSGSTWREAAGQSRPHQPRGGGCVAPLFSLHFVPMERCRRPHPSVSLLAARTYISARAPQTQNWRGNVTAVLPPQPFCLLSAAFLDPADYRSLTVEEEKKKSGERGADTGRGRRDWDREPSPDEIYINYSTIMRAL